MQDAIINETGNSRYLRSIAGFLQTYPNYEAFAAALVAGTLPIDLAGINADGFAQVGTDLNKANLLTDATAALAGLGPEATPNTMFATLAGKINQLQGDLTALQNRVDNLIGSGTTALVDGTDMTNELYVKF